MVSLGLATTIVFHLVLSSTRAAKLPVNKEHVSETAMSHHIGISAHQPLMPGEKMSVCGHPSTSHGCLVKRCLCHVCRAAPNVPTHHNKQQNEVAQKSESESASSGSGDDNGCNGIASAANQVTGTGIHQSIGICVIRRGAVRFVTTRRAR